MRLYPCPMCDPHCGEWFIYCCKPENSIHYKKRCDVCHKEVPKEMKKKREFLMGMISVDLIK